MDTLFVVDVAVIICLMVLANLSRRIGEALRIPAIYSVFYGASALIIIAVFIDAVVKADYASYVTLATIIVRVIAVIITIPVAVKY